MTSMSPQPTPLSDAALSEAVDTLLTLVVKRYQGQLSVKQVASVRVAIRGMLNASARLDAYLLSNADSPDFVFAAYSGND